MMASFSRRELLKLIGVFGAMAATRKTTNAAEQEQAFRPARLKITDVEVHEIVAPYQDYNAKRLFRHRQLGFQSRTVYVIRTDRGLEGYGETGNGPAPRQEEFAYLIGRNPFLEFNRVTHLGMSMALYDLLGKYLGVPLSQLIGPQVRTWIPLSAWTMSQPPEGMAKEVVNLSKRGYNWMKFHVDFFQNVVDQTEAMQRVAPPGFRLQYDFNGDESLHTVLPIMKELEKFPIAGRVEDPIRSSKPADRDDWRLLREATRLPILSHAPGTDYLIERAADGCLISRFPVPEAIRAAHVAEAANAPFMLQHVGGNITLAFLAHEASVFKMAKLAHIHCGHLWKDDVTVETLPIVGGSVKVPKGPGLGVTLDREKLGKLTAPQKPKRDRFIVRMKYHNGLTVYLRFVEDPYQAGQRYLNGAGGSVPIEELPNRIPGSGPMYRRPVVTDFWDETGTAEFEQIWKRTESGPCWTS
jgi:L-alanine-DL-glutamate epimerase-like enolase superfamily enzyme